MRKGWTILISIVFSVLLAVHMLISFIMAIGLDSEIYRNAQIADEVAVNAEITQETLDLATNGLIEYMDGDRDDLIIQNPEKEGHELFNSKEKAHMVDVKDLFILGKRINTALFIVLLLILIFYLIYDKEGMRRYFSKYSSIVLLIILGVWLIIAVLAIIDFTAFWTVFHKVFFTNDLWLLNPKTDLLIRMMPQRFFVRIVVNILIRFLTSYAVVLAVFGICHKLFNKRRKYTLSKGKKNE